MRSCNCWQCSGNDYHIEQMKKAEEAVSKDDYMENKPPSIYEKLNFLHSKLSSTRQMNTVEEIMSAVSAVDNELIALALELPTEQAEKLLDIQMRLY